MNLLELIAALAAYLNLERLGELAARLIQSTVPDDDPLHADVEALSDPELEELRTLMATARDTLLDENREDGLSDEVLAHLETARQIIVAQAAEETRLAEDAANREAERERLAAEINSILDGPPEGEPEGGEGEGEGAGEGEGGEGEGGEGAGGAEGGSEGAGDGAPAGQPAMAAAGTPASPATRISGVRARRPAANQPRVASGPGVVPFTAAGSFGGYDPGHQLTPTELGAVMEEAVLAGRGYTGTRMRSNVGRLAITQWPDERFLTDNVRENARKLDATVSRAALAAAGGICAPVAVSLDMPTIGQDDRPIASTALTRFGAEARGAVSTLPPPILGDATDAITIWTHANDRKAAGLDGGSPSPATKPCMRITCPEEETTIVDAIVSCIELGNFELRFFRENAEAWQRIMLVEAARIAENKLLQVIDDGSVDVSVAPVLGTVRNVFAALDRATAKYRWIHRDYSVRFRWIAPYNLFFNMRADLVRQMPVGTMDETMALAEATIARWLEVRGINVTWHKDGLAGQTWSAQGDGPLEGWQDTASTYLYPEGEWLFLDGGRLDFGVVRDSVLNATNDVQIEFEIFEQAHHHGRDSWNITFDVVPDGTYSAPVELDLEATLS